MAALVIREAVYPWNVVDDAADGWKDGHEEAVVAPRIPADLEGRLEAASLFDPLQSVVQGMR